HRSLPVQLPGGVAQSRPRPAPAPRRPAQPDLAPQMAARAPYSPTLSTATAVAVRPGPSAVGYSKPTDSGFARTPGHTLSANTTGRGLAHNPHRSHLVQKNRDAHTAPAPSQPAACWPNARSETARRHAHPAASPR